MSAKSRSASVGSVKKKMRTSFLIREPFEWTDKQSNIIDIILNEKTKCVFINGCAGVGKTELAVFSALNAIQQKTQTKIIYMRSIVESATNKLGFLKGSISEKTDPYFEVLEDKLSGMLNNMEIEILRSEKQLIAIPNSFIRGKDYKDSFIIIDEAQNFTTHELVSIISRVSENTKILFLYDPEQSDISPKYKNDITRFNNIFKDSDSENNGIFSFSFNESEIKRSEFCKFVMSKIKKEYI